MKRIRIIATALMLSASLFGPTAYALTPEENESQLNSNAPSMQVNPALLDNAYAAQNENGNDLGNNPEGQNDLNGNNADSTNLQDGTLGSGHQNGNSSEGKSSFSLLDLIALIVGAGAVVLGWTNRKSIENLAKNNKDLKGSTNKAVNDLTARIATLEQNLSIARQTIDKQNNVISNLRRAQEILTSNMHPSYATQGGMAPEVPIQSYQASATTQASPQVAQQPIRLYCGAPNGGVFTNPSRTPSNKSLYVITYTGAGTSNYSYVDTRDAAMLAARSISDFLEPGCIISGTKNPNFTKVKTSTPGTVRRQPNGSWVIESKAVVELI